MGVIKGGTAHNITSKDCTFEMDIRVVSDQKVDFWIDKYSEKVKEIESEMKAFISDSISFTFSLYLSIQKSTF